MKDHDELLREGSTVFVRTVTHNFIGTICRVATTHEGVPLLLTLNPCAWIPDTVSRLGEFLASGILKKTEDSDGTEVEVYPNGAVVGCGALVDVSPWAHGVPEKSQ